MMHRGYGKRGGTGATAGRKAETLIDPVTRLRKRVFFGQRWLLVQHDPQHGYLLRAFHSAAEAQALQDIERGSPSIADAMTRLTDNRIVEAEVLHPPTGRRMPLG